MWSTPYVFGLGGAADFPLVYLVPVSDYFGHHLSGLGEDRSATTLIFPAKWRSSSFYPFPDTLIHIDSQVIHICMPKRWLDLNEA